MSSNDYCKKRIHFAVVILDELERYKLGFFRLVCNELIFFVVVSSEYLVRKAVYLCPIRRKSLLVKTYLISQREGCETHFLGVGFNLYHNYLEGFH